MCWFSISLSCFVNAVNDGLASGSFCQQFIMIWYLRKIISSLFVISTTNFSGIVRVAFFLTFLLFSSRSECQKVKNKWLFKLFKHIIKTSSLILVWYYLVTLSSLKLRNKIWLVLYHGIFFKIYKNVYNLSSTCCGLGILYPSWSKLAIFLPSIRGYGEPPEI